MTERPFRPAREIAIEARRTGRNDPANYHSPPCPAEHPVPDHWDVLATSPAWARRTTWPVAALAILLLSGCALTWLGQIPWWGFAALASTVIVALLWPILFPRRRGRRRA